MSSFVELNADQAREAINTQQRYSAFRLASSQAHGYRGSMVWSQVNGQDYLIRAAYDKTGKRKQTSLGARTPKTEQVKQEFDAGRRNAAQRLDDLSAVIQRQASINRAIGLGRVPQLGARIIRQLDDVGLLGNGLRVLGTYALFAYEATAGVFLDPGLTTTEDIDLLLDARHGLSFAVSEAVEEQSLLTLLRRVDRSFERTAQGFRAANKDGYLVDLIKPMRNPPWALDKTKVGNVKDDMEGAEIEGLVWHESAPAFESVCIDSQGRPLRIVTSDPRVWAIHKYWLSQRPDRAPLKRRRDAEQSKTAFTLIQQYMPHLPLDKSALRMMPETIIDQALATLRLK